MSKKNFMLFSAALVAFLGVVYVGVLVFLGPGHDFLAFGFGVMFGWYAHKWLSGAKKIVS